MLRLVSRGFALVVASVACAACTAVLDIDGDYVAGVLASGGRQAGSGAAKGAGGAGATDAGSSGGSGGVTTSGCELDEKLCAGACLMRDVSVGCGRESCDPCPQGPLHSSPECVNDECDFQCEGGYVRNLAGTDCEPAGGGAGGAGSTDGGPSAGGSSSGGAAPTGGSGSACDPTRCPACFGGTAKGCCTSNDRCGCLYIAFPGVPPICQPGV